MIDYCAHCWCELDGHETRLCDHCAMEEEQAELAAPIPGYDPDDELLVDVVEIERPGV